ncbi:MAG: leucine-rich repeat protein [bacterium]
MGNQAFLGCVRLTSITIGNNVTSIGEKVFSSCSNLTAITVDTGNSVYSSMDGVLFNKRQTTLITYPGGKTGSYTIPDSVTSIDNHTFFDCYNLTSITIGNNVTRIGEKVFSSCSNLTAITVDAGNSVYSSMDGVLFNKSQTTLIMYPGGKTGSYTFPDSVTSIGELAFSGCHNLTSITLPNNVTSIGNQAFSYCRNLTSVYFMGNAPSLGTDVFTVNDATIYYQAGTTGWSTTFGGRPTAEWTAPVEFDIDNDGIKDSWEEKYFDSMQDCTPDDDSDGDGLTNLEEYEYFVEKGREIDPKKTDTDDDGLSDKEEVDLDINPVNPDSDGDGMDDGWEVKYGLNPGQDDANEDLDVDSFKNIQEYLKKTFPNDPESVPENILPTAPGCNSPENDDEVDSEKPTLSINNAVDNDGDTLTYTFEVYADEGLTNLVASESGIVETATTTSWKVKNKLDNEDAYYYWQAKANDGHEDGPWMKTVRFFLNKNNTPPSIPEFDSPADGGEVTDIQPTLTITNATDPEKSSLYYEFEVYADEGMKNCKSRKTDVFQDDDSETTSWRVGDDLFENTSYWWSARARDNKGAKSDWIKPPRRFFVNTSNDTPTSPLINSPTSGEIDIIVPELVVNNSTDADGDTLIYHFEIDRVESFNSADLKRSGNVDEGTGGQTSWEPGDLAEDTDYYWRAQACDPDLACSEWVKRGFFVNTKNNPPNMPNIIRPKDGEVVSTSTPELELEDLKIDKDKDKLTYDFELYFELYKDSVLVASKENQGNLWEVLDVKLVDGEYSWKAMATDEHGLSGDWSVPVYFEIKAQAQTPNTPECNNPSSGSLVTSLTPTLSVVIKEKGLKYEFELYSDKKLTELVASGTDIVEGGELTSWTVPVSLEDQTTYYWRAQAVKKVEYDQRSHSGWTATSRFMVDTNWTKYQIKELKKKDVQVSEEGKTLEEIELVVNAGEDSKLDGVIVEIAVGTIIRDKNGVVIDNEVIQIVIGEVESPPALENDKRASDKFIEFGPSGITFDQPVTIKIPYIQADLDKLGTKDPGELKIFTYNESTFLWEEIPIKEVKEGLLIAEVSHFSAYTVTKMVTVSTPNTDDTDDTGGDENGVSSGGVSSGGVSSGDGGDGGGCFINLLLN